MANLTVVARFTIDKAPATGLTLAEIDLYLTAVNKSSGAETVVWDGTENPTAELTGQGAYLRVYNAADFETFDYLARAVYTGATVLDSSYAYSQAVDNPADPWVMPTRTLTSFGTLVADILAGVIETGLTLKNALRVIAASAAGKLSGAATSQVKVRSAVADDKDRITADVDSNGNRTNITYDLSD